MEAEPDGAPCNCNSFDKAGLWVMSGARGLPAEGRWLRPKGESGAPGDLDPEGELLLAV